MSTCLIVDDHPGVVAVLEDLLGEGGFEVCGTAHDGAEAIRLAAETRPTCAVVDYRMDGLHGADLIASLRASSPNTKLVVYTAEGAPELANEARLAGAAGIVLKESALADVIRALDSVVSGTPYLDPALIARAPRAASNPLTDREREVLTLVADGLSYQEIAGRLGIGDETARTHLKKACVRLGATTRTQAVAKALRLGLIQ